MNDSYAALHCHSTYSKMDGIGQVGEWVAAAKEKGLAGIAITDHGDASSMLELYEEGKKQNFPVVLGCEFYFTMMPEKIKNDRYSHLIIWARNQEGYKNICKLSRHSYQDENFYFKPRITFENLCECKEGLIIGSACAGGIFSGFKKEEEADYYLQKFVSALGAENIYLELQHASLTHDWDEKKGRFVLSKEEDVQKITNLRFIKFAEKYGVKLIATPDAHMVDKGQKVIQDIQIKNMFKTNKTFRETYYLPTRHEFTELFHEKHPYLSDQTINEAFENTYEILDKCKDLELNFGYNLPDAEGNVDVVRELIKSKGIINLEHQIYAQRLEEELEVIANNGIINLLPYFMVLYDLVDWCEKNDVMVGPGRGSAAGCLLNYGLGITKIDPIKYDLPFSRFLNASRIRKGTFPDIDLDLSDQQQAKDYLANKYGNEHVYPISVNQTLKARSAIKDVVRILDPDMPAATINELTKKIPYTQDNDQMPSLRRGMAASPKLKNYLLKERTDVLKAVAGLIGQVRQRGIHAAAVVISKDPVHHVVPVCKNKTDGTFITQYTMKWCEKAGLIKCDLLNLKTLRNINLCLKKIKEAKEIDVDINKIDVTDEKIFKEFEKANTDTVFQFSADFVKEMLTRMNIKSLDDLANITSLCRPGPLDMKMHESYVARSKGLEDVILPHDALKNVLHKTYGIIVYQEQVMQAVKILGGFTDDEADDVRRAMGKKKAEVLEPYKVQFIEYASTHYADINKDKANNIWDLINSFAGYGFNAAHAYSYAKNAYDCMWLKTYYPIEWWAAVISNEEETDKTRYYYHSNRDLFLMPDVNVSTDICIVKDERIILPLTLITKIGPKAIEDIMKKRPFLSFKDFCDRVDKRKVNKATIMSLIWAGGFKSLSDKTDKDLLYDYYFLSSVGKTTKETTTHLAEYEKEISTLNRFEILQRKAEACPVYEPDYMKYFKDRFSDKLMAFDEIETYPENEKVSVGGLIGNYHFHEANTRDRDNDGNPIKKKMAFAELVNSNKTVKLTLFPDTYSSYSEKLKERQLVEISGRVNRWNGRFGIVVNNIKFLNTND